MCYRSFRSLAQHDSNVQSVYIVCVHLSQVANRRNQLSVNLVRGFISTSTSYDFPELQTQITRVRNEIAMEVQIFFDHRNDKDRKRNTLKRQAIC